MDPGTLGCTWIAWPEAGRRREFRSSRIPQIKQLAKGRTEVHELDYKRKPTARPGSKNGSLTGFLTHAQSGVNAEPHK